jgi:hypothetical protein
MSGDASAGASSSPPGVPPYVWEFCLGYAETACEKAFACNPAAAPTFTGISDAAGCPGYAQDLCKAQAQPSDGDCPKVWPTMTQVNECESAIADFTCSEWVSGDVPLSCQQPDLPCSAQ